MHLSRVGVMGKQNSLETSVIDGLKGLYAFMNGVTLNVHVFSFPILVPEPKQHPLSLGVMTCFPSLCNVHP